MNQDYIKPDNWSIIEEGFDAERVKSSESLFSIGKLPVERVCVPGPNKSRASPPLKNRAS